MSIITHEDCRKVIESLIKVPFTLISFKISRLSETPIGFLGDHFRLKIYYKLLTNTNNIELHEAIFFLKTVPELSGPYRSYVSNINVFMKEALMYKCLIEEFQQMHKEPIAPRSFLINPGKLIVLEDMSLRNFSMLDRLGHRDMCNLMRTMARFHASSIIYEQQQGIRLGDKYPEIVHETTFNPNEGEERYHWGITTSQAVYDAIVQKDVKHQGIAEHFLKFTRKDIFQFVFPSSKYRNVVCHADLWKNNMMFEGDEQCVLIDFQLVRYSPPAMDVMTCLHVNCTTQYLSEYAEQLHELYYTTFENTLRKHQIDAQQILSKATFQESLREYKLAGITEAIMFGTITFLGDKFAQKMIEDEAVFLEFMFTNRSKHVLEEMSRNPKFARRFGDILDRLIEHLKKL